MQKKYFWDNITVYKFCKLNELNYAGITLSFRYYIQRSEDTLDLIIERVIDRYIKRKERNRVIQFIRQLEVTGKYNFNLISRFLNLDYFSMYRLHKSGFSKKDAFYIVWFLSDKINKKGAKTISLKKKKEFLTIYANPVFSKDVPFMFLIALYKMGNSNVAADLLKQRNSTLVGIVRKEMRFKKIDQKDFEDFKQSILLNELSLYSKIVLNNDLQIFKYLNICAKYTVYKLANIKKQEQNMLRLDDDKYDGRSYMDFIDNDSLWR